MARVNVPSLKQTGCSLAEISQWRTEVSDFFESEWEKLRSLMMEMEELSWNSAENCQRTMEQIEVANVRENRASETQGFPDTTVEESRLSNVRREQISQEPPRHRLAELAELIEQRIQAAHSEGGSAW